MASVVDESVLVIANDLTRISLGLIPRTPQADENCRLACVAFLENLMENGSIVIDDGTEFLEKYKAHCSFSGQPGIGDAFFRAVFERGYDPTWVDRVTIAEGGNYLLPDGFLNSGFHNDDFLWVSAAYNGPVGTHIANGCDSDYGEFAGAITAIGVEVVEVCA